MGDITQLLARAREGDRQAFDALFQALYPDLRRIARARLAPHVRGTLLDTSALVHEAYLKFEQGQRLTPEDRTHFLAYASHVMRSIIVDAARASRRERRGGDAVHVPLDTGVADAVAAGEEEILDVHEALERLGAADARLARVVEMRYFGGMKESEIGEALGITERTVRRDWEKARLLLADHLRA
ncbi:ECF-type sigma factor [Piscinibacter sp. XHJ-5]|uniref:ECF-type sigma factor n=1 Tax=Piscinibacter sp. XHJ-5 TaxID=3037797 RepID=UPI0024535C33|nr:ECF-type sigma factor [Piscinibacter sp. XHJ-5]